MGMQVTESNKHDYAKRLAQLRTTEAIRPQLTVFLEGFHQFIPRPLLKVFDTHELQVRPSHRTQQHRHARASISFRSRYPSTPASDTQSRGMMTAVNAAKRPIDRSS
jgi:hypothetical protein